MFNAKGSNGEIERDIRYVENKQDDRCESYFINMTLTVIGLNSPI